MNRDFCFGGKVYGVSKKSMEEFFCTFMVQFRFQSLGLLLVKEFEGLRQGILSLYLFLLVWRW